MSRLSEDDMVNIKFASTQMQGRLEEFDEISKEQANIKKNIESLQKFKNSKESPKNTSKGQDGNLKELKDTFITKSKRSKTSKRDTKRDTKRIKSLTSLMEDTYNKGKSFHELKQPKPEQKDVQLSIFQYFSGHKEKIADILKRIQSIENEKSASSCYSEKQHESKILYTENEWTNIIKSIKLRFPELSPKTKKSLKYITRKIQFQDQSHSILDCLRKSNSIWSQASAPPDTELTEEDLKWLYDLTQEQTINDTTIRQEDLEDMGYENPFVMTLSQVMNTTMSEIPIDGENDIILDSSPEPSPLRTNLLNNGKLNNNLDCLPLHKMQVKNSVYDPLLDGDDIFSHQQDSIQTTTSIESFPFAQICRRQPENGDIIEITEENFHTSQIMGRQPQSRFGTQDSPIELSSSSSLNRNKSNFIKVEGSTPFHEEKEVIMSSPIKNTELFKTPTKMTPRNRNIMSSPLTLHSKHSLHLIHSDIVTSKLQLISSKIFPEQGVVNSENSSVYATAKSKFRHSSAPQIPSQYHVEDSEEDEAISPSIPVPQLDKKRKKYRTSCIMVNGSLNVDSKNEDSKVKIKMIGTKPINVDSENEICDSEHEREQDNSVSVIEITRELDDTEELVNIGRDFINEQTTHDVSVLQVPSSPQMDNFNVLSALSTSKPVDIVFNSSQIHQALVEPDVLAPSDNKFNNMSTKELKEKFQEWGLKPVKNREKMIQIVSETEKLIDQSQLNQDQDKPMSISASQFAAKASIYNNISHRIKQNHYWFDKVLSFEPINLGVFQEWLESGSVGVRLERNILERYCDELGIAYTDTR